MDGKRKDWGEARHLTPGEEGQASKALWFSSRNLKISTSHLIDISLCCPYVYAVGAADAA